MKKAVLVTSFPSPYMIELVDQINLNQEWRLDVIYLHKASKNRQWKTDLIKHEHVFFDEIGSKELSNFIDQFDLVVIGSFWGKCISETLLICRARKIPFVLWVERPGTIYRNYLFDLLRKLILQKRFAEISAIWGIGDWAVSEYKKYFSNLKNFSNLPYAQNLKPYLKIKRKKILQVNSQRPLNFLFSGSLIKRKGVHLLVPAFIKLIKEGYPVTLTLMGFGQLESELRKIVAKKNIKNIKFLGFVEWKDLPRVYEAHDVLIAPSIYDGWGLVIVEGLASGMPVIASNMMGSSLNLINENLNGWIVEHNNIDALSDAIKKACSSSIFEMGIAARESALGFDIKDVADRWIYLANKISINR